MGDARQLRGDAEALQRLLQLSRLLHVPLGVRRGVLHLAARQQVDRRIVVRVLLFDGLLRTLQLAETLLLRDARRGALLRARNVERRLVVVRRLVGLRLDLQIVDGDVRLPVRLDHRRRVRVVGHHRRAIRLERLATALAGLFGLFGHVPRGALGLQEVEIVKVVEQRILFRHVDWHFPLAPHRHLLNRRLGAPVHEPHEAPHAPRSGQQQNHEQQRHDKAACDAKVMVQRPRQQRAQRATARPETVGLRDEVGVTGDRHPLLHDALGKEDVHSGEHAHDQQRVRSHPQRGNPQATRRTDAQHTQPHRHQR